MLGNGWTVDVIAHIFDFMRPTNRIACALEAMAADLQETIIDMYDEEIEELIA